MGFVFSTLRSLRHEFKSISSRLSSAPHLLSANPTESTWQSSPSPLASIASETLPSETDVLIIGSGITAASICYHLLSDPNRPLRIIVVEQRTLSSAATGRNGGHIKAVPYDEWEGLLARHGLESAKELIDFRLQHLDWIMDAAKELGIVEACEIRRVQSVDVFYEKEVFDDAARRLEEWLQHFPAQRQLWGVWSQEAARSEFGVPNACGAISTSEAGALSPYAFVTGVFAALLQRFPQHLTIETNTTVLGISAGVRGTYTVTTQRGNIEAKHVVHATNAQASRLLPGLRRKIIPVRGQMTHLRTIPPLPGGPERSWSFVWKKGMDYLTIRPDGGLMLGGGWARGSNMGLDTVGQCSDDQNNAFEQAYLTGLLPTLFNVRTVESVGAWTGILGFSVDLLPWVGEVPERIAGRKKRKGREWIAAGYSGEGMVNAWGCGKGVANGLLTGKMEIPEDMRITERRVRKGSLGGLVEAYF